MVLGVGRNPLGFGIGGAAPAGGLGADAVGGLGVEVRDTSGSDRYAESCRAPVSTPPPVFRSFGMPPASIPPNCGAPPTAPPRLPSSLLLLTLLPPGAGGASPPDGFPSPGTGGAPGVGPPPPPPDSFPTIGADRSFVTAFFSFVPLVMSPSSAP